MAELSYINENGDHVFTSQFLKNRGSCCRSSCLHCPYGLTLKNFGLEFKSIHESSREVAQDIINLHQKMGQDVATSLLSSAFGKAPSLVMVSEKNIQEFSFVLLKNVVCAVAHHGQYQIHKIFLAKNFDQQGLDKDIVQSYFLDRKQ